MRSPPITHTGRFVHMFWQPLKTAQTDLVKRPEEID